MTKGEGAASASHPSRLLTDGIDKPNRTDGYLARQIGQRTTDLGALRNFGTRPIADVGDYCDKLGDVRPFLSNSFSLRAIGFGLPALGRSEAGYREHLAKAY
ncbi:hypothetical protein D6851_15950 [Altericroceibacterium spongiae]|uniref:Uncharacterized protein n=1 Tax=Altericroceibacterium spongiae TaxID=2320269 RepID=A0A420EAM4_9SPHN|nr:hypothetical protein [Altericroceibacterium spongiae]RKF17749.1 hypothetical protein D6851_15950 [Altericroceibacterium spongiae]